MSYDEDDDELPYIRWEREQEERGVGSNSTRRDVAYLFMFGFVVYAACLLAVLTARLIK